MVVLAPDGSATERWLVALLRAATGTGPAAGGGAPPADAVGEWRAVAALAREHGVGPVIHGGLPGGREAHGMPPGLVDALTRARLLTARRNALRLEAGRELLEQLDGRGVVAAPVGAWALVAGADPVYADPGLRPLPGLDVMVAREDRARAMHVLAGMGFVRATSVAPGDAPGGVAFHRPLGDLRCVIRLHWSWSGERAGLRELAVPGRVFLERFCARSRASCPGRVPTPVGQFLVTAIDAALRGFPRWVQLVDLHLLAASGRVDWEALVTSARAWRVGGPLYVSLLATRELLDTDVPGRVVQALAPGALRRRLLARGMGTVRRGRAHRLAHWVLGSRWWPMAHAGATAEPDSSRAPDPDARREPTDGAHGSTPGVPRSPRPPVSATE